MQGSFKASDFGDAPPLYPDSKIEIRGFLARHYDLFLDVATFGWYRSFLREAIAWMEIAPDDRIVDLGAGTGRNACLMAHYLSGDGKIVGVDIGREMGEQFERRCRHLENVTFLRQRIDIPFQLKEPFDKAVLFFVLHGFPHEVRETILDNCFNLLRPGGRLILVDYNRLSLADVPWYLRLPFKVTECPYAFDFIQRNIPELLGSHGFALEKARLCLKDMIRCISGARRSQ